MLLHTNKNIEKYYSSADLYPRHCLSLKTNIDKKYKSYGKDVDERNDDYLCLEFS